MATHVDRMFGFLEERKQECANCKKVRTIVSGMCLLRLPLPESREDRCELVNDLYLKYAYREAEEGVECVNCGRVHPHKVQRRVVSQPNVLLVQVGRAVVGVEPAWKHRVRIEELLLLPGLHAMELTGVVFHTGMRAGVSHYLCASRGPSKKWWLFDDGVCSLVGWDVSRMLPSSVYLLAYVRLGGGAVFAGGVDEARVGLASSAVGPLCASGAVAGVGGSGTSTGSGGVPGVAVPAPEGDGGVGDGYEVGSTEVLVGSSSVGASMAVSGSDLAGGVSTGEAAEVQAPSLSSVCLSLVVFPCHLSLSRFLFLSFLVRWLLKARSPLVRVSLPAGVATIAGAVAAEAVSLSLSLFLSFSLSVLFVLLLSVCFVS